VLFPDKVSTPLVFFARFPFVPLMSPENVLVPPTVNVPDPKVTAPEPAKEPTVLVLSLTSNVPFTVNAEPVAKAVEDADWIVPPNGTVVVPV